VATDMQTAILDALAPIVGRPIATICLRSCTVSIGKSADALTPADMPQIARTIRESLSSLTTQALLDQAIDRIGDSVR
jgi:hypothetical protein